MIHPQAHTQPDAETGSQRPHLLRPRLLTATEAAAYLGYRSPAVLSNIPVQPVRLASSGVGAGPRWDVKALDHLVDGLSGLSSPTIVNVQPPMDADQAFQEWSLRRVAQTS